jgi:hypothetical protein
MNVKIKVKPQSSQEASYDGKSMGSDERTFSSYCRLGALGVFFGDELGKFMGEELPANAGSASAHCEGYRSPYLRTEGFLRLTWA